MKTTLTVSGLGYDIYAETDRYSAYQIVSAIIDANRVNIGGLDLYDAIMTNDTFWQSFQHPFGKLTIKTIRS